MTDYTLDKGFLSDFPAPGASILPHSGNLCKMPPITPASMAVVQSHGPTTLPLIRCEGAGRDWVIAVIPTAPDGHTATNRHRQPAVTLINSPLGGNVVSAMANCPQYVVDSRTAGQSRRDHRVSIGTLRRQAAATFLPGIKSTAVGVFTYESETQPPTTKHERNISPTS